MHDFLFRNKRLAQIILALLAIPFAFFGVDAYFRSGGTGGDRVATVAGQPITEQEFAQALQERQNALRRILGDRVDPSQLDSLELRQAVLENLVNQRVLIDRAVRNRVLVSDRELQDIIAEQPVFQENGKFSVERYLEVLRRQGLSVAGFQNNLRRDIMVERLGAAYSSTAIVPQSVADHLVRLNAQQREVSQVVMAPDKFRSLVKLEEGAARQYYDAHQAEFRLPEQARVEYVTLSLDDVASQVQTSPEEVKAFYDQNAQRYLKGEERRASHILIAVDSKAAAGEKQAARAKAEEVLKQVKQNPSSFAEVAKKTSQDPGSAAKGGDLGFFPRGVMDKAFDDAVFQMKVGDIVGLIETSFGFHIIRLAEAKGAGAFEEVRKQAESDLKRQKASKRFSELGEKLRDVVFEQGDSLKPAAEALKLQVRSSGWISRTHSDDRLLNSPKLLQAVFSDDAIQNKRNTEVIDVGNNTLVAARVAEHKPATIRPFDQVSGDITKRLTQQRAAELAAKQGRELLAKLRQGEAADVGWSNTKLVSRQDTQGYSSSLIGATFKADASKLPAYAAVEDGSGNYTLLKISRVVEAENVDPARRKAVADQLGQMLGQEELSAYISALKLSTDVKVNQERLEKKQE